MQILTLLAKIVDDAANCLTKFDCWDDDEKIYYSGKCIAEEISDILEVDNVNGDCTVSFKSNENCFFEIDSLSYTDECGNEITYDVNKDIYEYVDSQDMVDVYHRLCEEATNLAVL